MLVIGSFSATAEEVLPHKQTKPPNKPYTPAEAIAKMTVPEGFTVELVAAEPDVVNPVAMTIDERGRFWITESLEYPRKPAGPGRDRVKVLEDADGDGTAEKVSIFLDGLNIPSGIAVGYGGVWIANAPDILFVPDANRDGVPDGSAQKVVTGFGRDDTHELPNSLTWGPDGWLYGLNGVFNHSHVRYAPENPNFAQAEADKHPGWPITCAMFRIHPRTREFQIFCEGTSNPWGIAFNDNGDAFISACVIDHLWHLVETGYYHRQGGPYPPHTWKLESIVNYKHQMAAYCGITWFDSDAYPDQYRRKLYMGNIHGGCINSDALERNGATYKGVLQPDLLTANDAWFMPVVQKTGPDGCLYILDWYDRYHCYQDANRDPAGIDRLKGRLYRLRYQNTPRAKPFDLAGETDDQLIERLASPNIFYREIAQRLLAERNTPETRKKLEALVLKVGAPYNSRMHSFWALTGGGPLDEAIILKLLTDPDTVHSVWALRSWAVRAAGNQNCRSPEVLAELRLLAKGNDSDASLQVAIAAPKLFGDSSAQVLLECLEGFDSSGMKTQIVWQNLYPLLPSQRSVVMDALSSANDGRVNPVYLLLPRLLDWIFAQGESGIPDIIKLTIRGLEQSEVWWKHPSFSLGSKLSVGFEAPYLRAIATRLQSGELSGQAEASLRSGLERRLAESLTSSIYRSFEAAYVLCHWKHPQAIEFVKNLIGKPPKTRDVHDQVRIEALAAWASSRDPALIEAIGTLSTPAENRSRAFRLSLFDVLTRYEEPAVAGRVLAVYSQLEDDLKPAAIELLTSRVAWSHQLLDAIAAGAVSKDAVNVNQIRKLLKTGDKDLAKRVEQTWGALRTDRNPAREQVVAQMRKLLIDSPAGDPKVGQVVFTRLCGQCHKIHGQGQDVGPDITVNGRASFEQMLSNIFDPSLVIGNAYRARIVSTADGRVLTGLLVEDGPQRIVIKLQGGKLETIARSDVEEMEISKLSLMPEGVETQYKPQEIIDLFAFLKLDKPPTDPAAKTLPNFAELK